MTRPARNAARQLDAAIDDLGSPAPLVDAATLDVVALLQADADARAEAPIPGADLVRQRVLDAIVDLQMAEEASSRRRRAPRVRRARFGQRVLVNGMCALVACGATAALAAQTETTPGNYVRAAARTAAHALNLPAPAPTAGGQATKPRPKPTPAAATPTAPTGEERPPATDADRDRLLEAEPSDRLEGHVPADRQPGTGDTSFQEDEGFADEQLPPRDEFEPKPIQPPPAEPMEPRPPAGQEPIKPPPGDFQPKPQPGTPLPPPPGGPRPGAPQPIDGQVPRDAA